jgi:ATP-dependent RNA helicase DeaD
MRASLRERLLAGDYDDVRVVVDTLAQEFDIVDVAAAAVKMAHTAVSGDKDEQEIPVLSPRAAQSSASRTGREQPRRRPVDRGGPTDGPTVRLFLNAGRQAGIRPGDLVGAITGEAGVESRALGAIEIADRFSLVEVPESRADDIITALKASTIRGKRVNVRRERDSQ